ncbi:MAG: hypothetical protein KDB80_13655 [Planctomycetes bacterium]|nr:hypothetical protein [Planctomycetota bacterium]
MTGKSTRERVDALVREALANDASLRIAFLLRSLVPLDRLRSLARRLGVSVKGYRIERAPAVKLAPLLAELESDALAEVCEELLRSFETTPPAGEPIESDSVPGAVHELAIRAAKDAREKLERGESNLAKLRERVDQLQNEVRLEREARTRAGSEIRSLRAELREARSKQPPQIADLEQRQHDLERDLEALGESEAGLRRLLALRETRLRVAEQQIRELEELLPKGRRRKRKPLEPEATEPPRLRVPYFADSFYRSLNDKERQSVERAMRAVWVYCTEGPAYPGLEVKQIEGQDLWSLRASLKLRVYFRVRDDGDIDVLELSDREDQHTALRRWKER